MRIARAVCRRVLTSCLLLAGLWMLAIPGASAQTTQQLVCPPADHGGPIAAGDFAYNNCWTTKYGPAAADIVTKGSNMLSCKTPSGSAVSYGLCFYSGPSVATGKKGNPPLPCVLSADGKSANCTCYKLSTDVTPPGGTTQSRPYFIDINGILNLDVYKRTASAANCGPDGSKCAGPTGKVPEACTATNNNTMMPGAPLISVFSPLKEIRYAGPKGSPQTTACKAGLYAGCMTAPCADNGQKDAQGNPLVQCSCPVVYGPYEVGEPGVNCDATAMSTDGQPGKTYVWSASHNPIKNPGPPARVP